MSDVEDFIRQYEGSQREVLQYFHHLLAGELGLTDKIRFRIPFYYQKTWICYLNPTKNETVELAFIRGNELSNDIGILDNKGRKQVYGIEFQQLNKIPEDEILTVIQEAMILDETTPYASKRKPGKQMR